MTKPTNVELAREWRPHVDTREGFVSSLTALLDEKDREWQAKSKTEQEFTNKYIKRLHTAEAKLAELRLHGDALCREAAAGIQLGQGHLADAIVAWRTALGPEVKR